MRFLLLEGQHKQGDKKFEKGDLVTSDQQLDELFRCKFQQISDNGLAVSPDNPVAIPALNGSIPAAIVGDALCLEHGTEVPDFPEANAAGMRVFHKKGKYVVVDTDDNTVMNAKPLSWNKLEEFISDNVEEQSNENKDEE